MAIQIYHYGHPGSRLQNLVEIDWAVAHLRMREKCVSVWIAMDYGISSVPTSWNEN